MGNCTAGTVMCVDGTHQCVSDRPPSEELCDGEDNDCDGEIDEIFIDLGDACVTGLGECEAAGSYICANDEQGVICDAVTSDPVSETCDGLDNDCDGSIDNGFANLGESCSSGLGECESAGTYVCSGDGQSALCDAVAGEAGDETCDGLDNDNDCDGLVDEGTLSLFYIDEDGDGYGSATASTQACAAPLGYAGNDLDCADTNEFVNPGVLEVCNGIDDNCSGAIDGGDQCETSLLGACNQGTLTCQDGTLHCIPDFTPSSETCDQVDNDCDGNIDEIGCSPILVVDDDAGSNNRIEANIGDFPDVDHIYRSDLSALGYSYDLYRVYGNLNDGPDLTTLKFYDAVVWFTGLSFNGNSGSPATITIADQSNLSSYLDSGGRLFLSGGDLIYDLNDHFTGPVTNAFLGSYLGLATVGQDAARLATTYGVPSDPVSNGLEISGADSDQDGYVENFAVDQVITSENGSLVMTTGGGSITELEFFPSYSSFLNTVLSGKHSLYRLTDETLVFGSFSFWSTPDSSNSFDINWYHLGEGSPNAFTKFAAGIHTYQYFLYQGVPFDSYPDNLTSSGASAGATTLFTDNNGNAVATRVEKGSIPSTIFLAFPYEGLGPDASRRNVLDNSVQWLRP
jgi:hypothetical protein